MPINSKMDKIRVAHVIEGLEIGGAENMIVATVKNLDRNRFEFVVICLFGDAPLKHKIEEFGVSVICLNLNNPYNFFKAIFRICAVFKRLKFSIVHTHLYFANVYARISAKICGVPHVITSLHNPDYGFEDNGRVSYRIRKILDNLSGRICNCHYLAVSKAVKDDYENNLGLKSVDVLYNCIDTDLFLQLSTDRHKKRKELGFTDDDFVILSVGRLCAQKGQIYLLKAMRLLVQDQDYKLLIIGRGGLGQYLKQKVEEYALSGKVIFLENRSDVPEIMRCCDIFLAPSLYEGFGIAVVEAMASGLTVVASGIDTFKEFIRDGENGILAEVKDAELFSGVISGLRKDKKQREFLGKNARRMAVELFNPDRYARKLENVYYSLNKY